jgi:hypothetical protein
MKNDIQIKSELDKLYLSLECADTFPRIASLKVCGDPVMDLNLFTLYQGGGKSYDDNDPGNNYLPPEPDANGLYCGTVNDVTWVTWLSFFPNSSPQRFYNMTNYDRLIIVSATYNRCNHSKSKILNCFLAYCMWASGTDSFSIDVYKLWYNIDLAKEVLPFPIVLDRLIDIRLWQLSQMNNAELYYTGWSRGVLLLRKLLRQYIVFPLK